MFHKDKLSKYNFEISKDRIVMPARYINSGGFASSIIAVINFRDEDGSMFDWSVYWGGCDRTQRERDCYEWVAGHGVKMSTGDAQHFFDELPIALYRA